jgi:hypothetical protein|tara:strand:- start:3669 stop:4709 length:1041 start_codon:yes stop_codon:yes gene_type:complete
MPFTADQLAIAGKTSLEYYLKNKSSDQIAQERPWLKELMKSKGSMPGGKENAVVQLRYRYQSNFQFFNGRQQVTYNNRSTIEQASFPWRSAHDGFAIEEDRLIQNGISLLDDKKAAVNSGAERLMLQNLFQEQIEVMDLGFDEQFDQKLLLDGSGGTNDIDGLDHLVASDPTTGTVGGIDRSVAANSWWRNNVQSGLTTTTTTGTIIDKMEIAWRDCTKNGGRPNFIMAGSDFIDGYRNFMLKTYGRVNYSSGDQFVVEGGTEMLKFKGVPVIWNPTFDDLAVASPTWPKRCYFINSRYMQLKEIQGKISRKPPRPYDRYEHYFGMTWRGALCMTRANAHAVLSIA